MKFCRLQLLMLLVLTTDLFAQGGLSISVSIPASIASCTNKTFQVTVTNTSSNAYAFSSIGLMPENASIADFNTNPVNAAGYHIIQDSISIIPGTTVYTYSLNFNCNSIPLSGSSANTFNDKIQLFDLNGNALLANAYKFNYTIAFPYLLPDPTSYAPLSGSKEQTLLRDLSYSNTGTSSFNGAFQLETKLDCDSIVIDSMQLAIDNNTAFKTLLPQDYTTGTNGTLLFSFDMTAASQSIPVGSKLHIKQYIRIIACIDGCNNRAATATYNMKWGCAGDLCRESTNSARVTKTGAPVLMVNRLLPAANNPFNEAYWDVNCNGDQHQWKFRIKNTGNATVYKVKIPLLRWGGDFHYVDSSSIQLVTFFNTNHAPITQTNNFNTLPNPTPCMNQVNGFTGREYSLDFLAPGEYVELSFEMIYCCPSQADYNAKYGNLWVLRPNGIDECYTGIGWTTQSNAANGEYVFDFSTMGNISMNSLGGYGHIRLEQELEPTASHMTGARGDFVCQAGDSSEFHVKNSKFEFLDQIHTLTQEYTCISDFLCNTFNPNATLMTPRGQIKIRIETGAGLILTKPGGTAKITLSKTLLQGTDTWTADSIVYSNDCSSSNYFDAYFNIDNCPGVSTSGLKGFKDFMNNSWINFGLKACCCAEATGPVPYTIYTSLNAQPITNCNNSCWIPLAKIGNRVQVHCPGCITPGIIVNYSNMSRLPGSYGLTDSNNDGRAEGTTAVSIDSAYISNYPVAKNHSMAGDYVVQTVKAHFQDGDDGNGGISYDTWLGDSCNDPFQYLYMEQVIPYSDSGRFDLQACSIQFSITRGNNIYGPLTINGSDTSCLEKKGEKFFYKLSLPNLYANNLDTNYMFRPGDKFNLETTFRITRDPATTSQEIIDNKFESEISNMMYLTGTRQNSDAFANQATAVDIWARSCTTDTTDSANCTCTAIPPNAIFYCEPYGSFHYFYNTVRKLDVGMSDFTFPLIRCIKNATFYYTSYIGGYKSANAFPYEVRIPPVPVKFNFNQPYNGYKLVPQYTVTIVRSYANEDCLPFNEYQFVKSLVATDTSPFIIPLDTNDATYNSVSGCNAPTGAFPNAVVGDEHFYQTILLNLLTDCSNPQTIPMDINSLSVTIPKLDYDNCSGLTLNLEDELPTPVPPPGNFTFPQNYIDVLFDNPDQPAVGSTACFNFRLINPAYTNAVPYAFVYIPYSASYKVTSFNCLNQGCTPILKDSTNDGIIYRIGGIPSYGAEAVFKYQACIELTECLPTGIISIPYKWGWNCSGYPDSINAPICFLQDEAFTYKQHPLNIVTEFDNLKDSVIQCKPSTLRFKVTSVEQGGYKNLKLKLNLPYGVTIVPNTLNVNYNPTSTCNTAASSICGSCSFVNTSGQTWELNLSALDPLFGADFLNSGESVCINFDVVTDCNYLFAGNDILATLTAISYCGDTAAKMPALTDWVQGSSICSPLATAQITHVTTFGGMNGAINLTVTGGTAPYSILWTSGDMTEDLSNKPAGIYTVRISDAMGCGFERTFEITQPPRTKTCAGFRTQTQGGWGASPHGQNSASYLLANFSAAFPNNMVIGCTGGNKLTFTSSNDVLNFLPCGGTAAALSTSAVHPLCMSNVLAGQVTALALNVGFDLYDASFGSSATNLNSMYVRAAGTFYGWTVQQVLDTANLVLGGCNTNYIFSDINDIAARINENFDNGTVTGSTLTCTPPSARFSTANTGGLQFSLYPNPNSGTFTLNISGAKEETLNLRIYDVAGRLMYEKQIFVNPDNSTETVSIAGLAKGLFSAELTGKESRSIARFVIE